MTKMLCRLFGHKYDCYGECERCGEEEPRGPRPEPLPVWDGPGGVPAGYAMADAKHPTVHNENEYDEALQARRDAMDALFELQVQRMKLDQKISQDYIPKVSIPDGASPGEIVELYREEQQKKDVSLAMWMEEEGSKPATLNDLREAANFIISRINPVEKHLGMHITDTVVERANMNQEEYYNKIRSDFAIDPNTGRHVHPVPPMGMPKGGVIEKNGKYSVGTGHPDKTRITLAEPLVYHGEIPIEEDDRVLDDSHPKIESIDHISDSTILEYRRPDMTRRVKTHAVTPSGEMIPLEPGDVLGTDPKRDEYQGKPLLPFEYKKGPVADGDCPDCAGLGIAPPMSDPQHCTKCNGSGRLSDG